MSPMSNPKIGCCRPIQLHYTTSVFTCLSHAGGRGITMRISSFLHTQEVRRSSGEGLLQSVFDTALNSLIYFSFNIIAYFRMYFHANRNTAEPFTPAGIEKLSAIDAPCVPPQMTSSRVPGEYSRRVRRDYTLHVRGTLV